jgi:hypothetical protein
MIDIGTDGIAVFDGVCSVELCNKIISEFEWAVRYRQTWQRTEADGLHKKDESFALDNQERTFGMEHSQLLEEFNTTFFNVCYPAYAKKFPALNDMARHGIYTYKVQKTLPAEGYHVWHCEVDGYDRARRLSAYILYLNDVEKGGETEFLYQSKRIEARTGRLVIFPAGYMHVHRGNPPLEGTKYILTGWLEFM